MKIAFLGFGEAGPIFAHALLSAGSDVRAYDVLVDDAARRDDQIAKTEALGVSACDSAPEAVAGADLVISTVTASQAVRAAEMAAAGLGASTVYLDLNSVAPQTKDAARALATGRGARFVEGVAMDTVPQRGAQVPLLLCGPDAQSWSDTLNGFGLNASVAGDNYGMASSTKLIRSIFIKGLEALFAEAIEAAGKVGIADEVVASVQKTYPDLDWPKIVGYHLSRASIHAKRRSDEMRESAKLVESLGVAPLMATAIADRMHDLAERELGKGYQGEAIEDFLKVLKTR